MDSSRFGSFLISLILLAGSAATALRGQEELNLVGGYEDGRSLVDNNTADTNQFVFTRNFLLYAMTH